MALDLSKLRKNVQPENNTNKTMGGLLIESVMMFTIEKLKLSKCLGG